MTIEQTVNYPTLKGGASSFIGSSVNRGFASSATSNIASTGSTGDSRRYHPFRFKCDIFRRIDVTIMHRRAVITLPRANIQRHFARNHTALMSAS